jgi:Rod binding domain-containing protein
MSAADNMLAMSMVSLGQSTPQVRAGGGPDETRKAAEAFEQFFIAQMLDHMFAGIKTDGPFGGGNGEKIFRSLLNTEYAKVISQTGGIGIADVVQREMIKMQENSIQ